MSADVPVEARTILSKRRTLVAIFFAFGFLAGIIAVPYPYQPLLLAIWILVIISGTAFVMLRSFRRIGTVLRFDKDSASLRAGTEWHRLPPATGIEWKTSSSFVLQAKGMVIEFIFQSEKEARESARVLGSKFPRIEESHNGDSPS